VSSPSLNDVLTRTRDHRTSCLAPDIYFYSFLLHAFLFVSSFSPPRSYRLTNGLGRGYGGRRLKSRRRGRRQTQVDERWRARQVEIKKKLRVTLCPNASFCCRTRRPADYLSQRGWTCISVKSRSLHERRKKRERAHNRTYLEQDNNMGARRIAFSDKRAKL